MTELEWVLGSSVLALAACLLVLLATLPFLWWRVFKQDNRIDALEERLRAVDAKADKLDEAVEPMAALLTQATVRGGS